MYFCVFLWIWFLKHSCQCYFIQLKKELYISQAWLLFHLIPTENNVIKRIDTPLIFFRKQIYTLKKAEKRCKFSCKIAMQYLMRLLTMDSAVKSGSISITKKIKNTFVKTIAGSRFFRSYALRMWQSFVRSLVETCYSILVSRSHKQIAVKCLIF